MRRGTFVESDRRRARRTCFPQAGEKHLQEPSKQCPHRIEHIAIGNLPHALMRLSPPRKTAETYAGRLFSDGLGETTKTHSARGQPRRMLPILLVAQSKR